MLGSAGYGLYQLVNQPEPAAASFQTIKMTRLTATGKVKDAAISPDGKYVVYAGEDNRLQSLWVRQVATGSSVQIVRPADVVYFGLTFSNDSNYVYYAKGEEGGILGTLYQVSSLGGTPKKVIERVDSAVTFSPDGQRFAFVRADLERGESAVVTVNADGPVSKPSPLGRVPTFSITQK